MSKVHEMDGATGITILLIEDSPADADLFATLLKQSAPGRYHIIHAKTLGDGIQCITEDEPDLVLLDFSLPDSTGLSTYRRFRVAAPALPVIVLTSLEDDVVAANAVGEGAQDYLVKRDVDGALLNRAIRYALERHGADEALRESEERYALALSGANDGIWDWNLRTGMLYRSSRWWSMLGYEEAATKTAPDDWFNRVHPDDVEELKAALDRHFRGSDDHFEFEHRIIASDGHERWVLTRGCAVRDPEGRVVRMAGSQTDCTARKLAEQQLLYDAFHDGLTGLPNRALFLDRLGVAIAAGRRNNTHTFAVLFLDLDRFKNINDSLGHATGDAVLIETAKRLERVIRRGDTVARLGGDEFAILINDIDELSDAIHMAKRAQDALADPYRMDDQKIYVTVSIGVALPESCERTPEALLRDADIAMYRAKAAGRAQYQVFDEDMHRSAVHLLTLETQLRRALENNEFVLHYQPIVSLAIGRIVGFEALVRWSHPERGLVPPTHFIAIAEETGLIVPLGWWVLREACLKGRQWQYRFPNDPPLFMSVNVSGKMFAQDDASEQVLAILHDTGLPASSLRLEVTESMLMEHSEDALAMFDKLRRLGVKLSIDDFGTGYSSLSYLQRFRYDSLKIDRSFIARIGQTNESRTIVETILGLASSLGIGVIAEGIETADQVDQLRGMHCPHGQGFWFAHPVDAQAATDLLASSPSW
jgi:diguanylate cyclase (GGDEF)-like protein/PAS domain S-box-containing protein